MVKFWGRGELRRLIVSKPIEHGGTLTALRAAYPDAPTPWLDLSTGINPEPYPLPSLPPDCFARLPEPADARALEAAAALAYGVADPARVVAAPGTELLIDLLPRLFPATAVHVVGPTYAEHANAWMRAGSTLVRRDAATTCVLCNPNNPNGLRQSPGMLLELADRYDTLVVDEAFADLEDPPLGVAAHEHPALIVLRSFGKTYGLAGVRLGFAIASRARATIIRDALGPWAVSGPAIAIGRAALLDREWLAATRNRLTLQGRQLDRVLIEAGLRGLGGTRLFRLTDTPDAWAVHHRLAQRGIAVRRFAEHPTWLRFGQPGDGMARLRDALSPG